jgi:hypothetical protein
MADEPWSMFAERIVAARSLTAPPVGGIEELDWLHASHRSPGPFWAALFRALDETEALPLKSRPGGGFDPYHDMVVRHLGLARTALQVHAPRAPEGQRWQALSYDELHAQCTLRAAAWAAQGVEPGATVCVVLPFGAECVVAILAALRLGACVSLLEPGGPDLLARRLGALAPRHIVTDPFHLRALGPFAELALGTGPGAPHFGAQSRVFRPGEACAALFSPLRRPPHVPVRLRCDELFLGALRDGALTFALRPGDHLAAPGFDVLQHQPALVFAALVMGATFVHIAAEEALRDPGLLERFPLRGVGLSAGMCDVLRRTRAVDRPRWAHVFRNPEEPTDWESWRGMIDVVGLADTPMSNVVIEAAAGGALLCSPRRPGQAHLGALMNVAPAAGRPWTLLDFTGSGQAAVGDVGVFAPLAEIDGGEDGDPIDPHIVLGRRHGGEYLYGGATEPRRSGRVYPVAEVLAALEDCPFLRGASFVIAPAGGPTLEHRFVLLGFTGDEPIAASEALRGPRVEELQRVLRTRLSADHLPDRIALFPGFARLADGAVDHGWCQSQFNSGALYARARTPAFQRLTALRGALGQV